MIMTIFKRKKPSENIKFHHIHEILNCSFDERNSFIKINEKFVTNLEQAYRNNDQ